MGNRFDGVPRSQLEGLIIKLEAEREEARDWVRKLTSESRVLTCVYCGHAYPPGSPTHAAEVLTEHLKTCVKHPMAALLARLREIAAVPCVKDWGKHPMKCLPRDKCSFCRTRTLLKEKV